MANRMYTHGWVPGRNEVRIAGSFQCNGASNPLLIRPSKNVHWGVVRTSTGLYTVTFQDCFVELISFVASLRTATALARWTQDGPFSLSGKTIQIRTIDATGTVQDIPADVNNRVSFEAVFRNSDA